MSGKLKDAFVIGDVCRKQDDEYLMEAKSLFDTLVKSEVSPSGSLQLYACYYVVRQQAPIKVAARAREKVTKAKRAREKVTSLMAE